jgi:lysophospholipase L1-like esterase
MTVSPATTSSRPLVVGDSTAVGTGASSPLHSLPGLISTDYSHLEIVNRAADDLHPSDAGYSRWYEQLRRQVSLASLFKAGG